MATVNELVVLLACSACGHVEQRVIQFRYGWLRQLTYHIGSRLEWGEPSVGSADEEIATIQGWISACSGCGVDGDIAVVARSGKVLGVAKWTGEMKECDGILYRYDD